MRTILVIALAALLCIVDVSAAPQDPSASSQGVGDEVLDIYIKILTCVRGLMRDMIGKSEYKPLYEDLKAYYDKLLPTLVQCHQIKDDKQKMSCGEPIYHNMRDKFYAVRNKISAVNQEAAKKINHDVREKCVKNLDTCDL